jgi:hypothetical protein
MIPRRLRRTPHRARYVIETSYDMDTQDMLDMAHSWNAFLRSRDRTAFLTGASVKEIHP